MSDDIKKMIYKIKNLGKLINENVDKSTTKTQIFLDVVNQSIRSHFS